MYNIQNIITFDDEIEYPKCMYHMRKIYNFDELQTNINLDLKISEQVMKFLKKSSPDMMELEERQNLLIKKLDTLYNRIKEISSICNMKDIQKKSTVNKPLKTGIIVPDEIVMHASPDNLPWYLLLLLKEESLKVTWHIHSSVPKEKVSKVKEFVKHIERKGNGKTTLRLIFNNVSVQTELKLSSLTLSINGDVNVLRYLSILYPTVLPPAEDFVMDNLLDLCFILQNSSEVEKAGVAKKLFAQGSGWIYNNQFSIVDAAAYNVVKQNKNCPKYFPNNWVKNCQQLYT